MGTELLGSTSPLVIPIRRLDTRNQFCSVDGQLAVGVSGVRRNAAVATCQQGALSAFCEQERLTRVRGERLEAGRLPSAALAAVLRMAGARPSAVQTYVLAEEGASLPDDVPTTRITHHFAHAAGAFYTSPFTNAAVLVCDQHSSPELSVWAAGGHGLAKQESGSATGFASLYSACRDIFGFRAGQEHQLEALARLGSGDEASRLDGVIRYEGGRLWAAPKWERMIADWLVTGDNRNGLAHSAHVASAFQHHLGRQLLEVVREIRSNSGMTNLCLGGGLFFNTYFTTLIRQAGVFEDVFVGPNPGNAGLAAGAALAVSQDGACHAAGVVSPFLGPEYDLEEIKGTLDNCKLSYECLNEDEVLAQTVTALQRGRLVGWFQGRMEWGHKALGNRSILASPLSPYVLENLNRFLKHRERHRTYGLSVPESDAPALFAGPPKSTFMEYEYEILDRSLFRHVLPEGAAMLRLQTIPADAVISRRYWLLHKAFGQATGIPVLVNTSFNAFCEPMVCSPRDAVRVFFGTGLDMLVLDRFVVYK